MIDAYLHTFSAMGTVVTIEVVGHGETPVQRAHRERTVERAAEWFVEIESRCTRFSAASELMQLCVRVGEPVRVSEMVFEPVRFALAVAEETAGVFDPTVGKPHVSFRDVQLDAAARTITILKPLVLDLGAVAKGLAVDMAARELAPFENFAIDAGGDLYLSGRNRDGERWSVGIRHPRLPAQLIDTLVVSGTAVCTSGDYERATAEGHHIIDPRTGASATSVASVTVIAPTAMVADALGTAAFVLGPVDGLALLERHEVDGFIVTPALDRFATRGFDAHRRRPEATARAR